MLKSTNKSEKRMVKSDMFGTSDGGEIQWRGRRGSNYVTAKLCEERGSKKEHERFSRSL